MPFVTGKFQGLAAAILFASLTTASFADEPEERSLPQQYLKIYVKINDAEHLEKNRDYRGALADFTECIAKLEHLQHSDPNWETALVGHRLQDCTAKIVDLRAKAQAEASGTNPSSVPTAVPFFASAALGYSAKKIVYPWKVQIVATLFWIGEGSNNSSAWNEKWAAANNGDDSPRVRNGYASGKHASSVNPFYVALPFNDLAFPDKARRWLPEGWKKPEKDGKPISACKNRWVEIKNKNGDICYAQWEDVGPCRKPLQNDDAEYVFGDQPPGNVVGIDVSPAVGDYLGLSDHNNVVSWRFVDDQDVRPGAWLKLDEQAVLYTAMHEAEE
jgi:hypothetical protein